MSGVESRSTTEDGGVPDGAETVGLNRGPAGDALGAALFLGADDLRALGVDDADELAYWVTERGEIEIAARGEGDD